LSFRYDLHSVRLIAREMLEPQQLFAQAPPTGSSTHVQNETVVLAQLGDEAIDGRDDAAGGRPDQPVMAQVRERRGHSARGANRPMAGLEAAPASTTAERKQAPGGDSGLDNVARLLRARNDRVVIEGFADPGERDGTARAAQRAIALK